MVPEDIGGLPSTPSLCGPPQPGTVLHSSGGHPVISPTVEWSRTNSGASVSIASARVQKEQEAWDYAHQLRDQRISDEWSEHYKYYYKNHYAGVSAKLKYDKIQLQNQLDGVNEKKTKLAEATDALQIQLKQSDLKSKNRLSTNIRLAAALGEQMQKTQTLEEEKNAGDARIKALELEKATAEKEYNNDLRNKQREVDEKARSVKSVKAELQKANQAKKDLVEERNNEREANTRLNAELKAAEQKRSTAEENLRGERRMHKTRVDLLQGDIQKHKSALKALEQRNSELEKQFAEHKTSATNLRSELDTVKSDLAAAEAQATRDKDQLRKEENHLRKEQTKTDELQRLLDESTIKVDALSMTLSSINAMTNSTQIDQPNAATIAQKELTPPKTPYLSQPRPAFSSPASSPPSPVPPPRLSSHQPSNEKPTRSESPPPPPPRSESPPPPPPPPTPPPPVSTGAAAPPIRIPLKRDTAPPKSGQKSLSYDTLPKIQKKPGTENKAPTEPAAMTGQKRRVSSVSETSVKKRRGVCYKS